MRRRLLLLGHPDDAALAAAIPGERFDGYVPLCAEARRDLERAGLPVLLPGAVVGQARHLALARQLETEVEEIVAALNDRGSRGSPAIENVGECFRTMTYNHLARYSAIAQIVDRAAEAYDVSYFSRPLRRDSDLTAAASDALGVVASSRDHVRAIVAAGVPQMEPVNRSPVRAWRRTAVRLGMNGVLRARAARSGRWWARRSTGLVLNGFRQWSAIGLHPGFRAGVRLEFSTIADETFDVVPSGTPPGLVDCLSNVMGGRLPRRAFEDLASRVAGFIAHVGRDGRRINRRIARCSLIVGSVFDAPLGRYCCMVARRQGKDVVILQHGAMNMHAEPKHLAAVEADATHYLSWGSAIEEKRAQLEAFGHLRKIWVVGAVRNKVKYVGGDTVVYATGKYFSNTVMSYYVDPDARLYDAQKALLAFFDGQQPARAGRVRFVLKANNTPGANEVPFETAIPIERDARFTDLLATAKAVVLDCPATTCVEAAATRVPLFVLTGRTKWFDIALQRLARRAIVCDSVPELTAALERFLDTGAYPADVANTEFADAYFGTEDVGASVAKISDVFSAVLAPAHAG